MSTIPHGLDKLKEKDHINNFDKAAKLLKSGAVRQDAHAVGDNPAAKALEGNPGEQDNSGPGSAKAADPAEGGIVGHSAFDSDVHKALEGACQSLCQQDDPVIGQGVESFPDRVLAAQQDGGYLISYFTAKEPDKKWFGMLTKHEIYNAGHFFKFAVAHHQHCRDPRTLDAAKRFADHIGRTRFSDAPEYAAAVRTLWNDVVSRKIYLTVGLGTAQYGDEGLGDPYLLPNKNYCESCASIANVLWQHRMNLLDGEAKYGDVMSCAPVVARL